LVHATNDATATPNRPTDAKTDAKTMAAFTAVERHHPLTAVANYTAGWRAERGCVWTTCQWVDSLYSVVAWPRVELATSWSQVQRRRAPTASRRTV